MKALVLEDTRNYAKLADEDEDKLIRQLLAKKNSAMETQDLAAKQKNS